MAKKTNTTYFLLWKINFKKSWNHPLFLFIFNEKNKK